MKKQLNEKNGESGYTLILNTVFEKLTVTVLKDAHAQYHCEFFEKKRNAFKIDGIIENAFKICDIEFKDISGIAAFTGPGSFTGLRIGLSAVKGLAEGAGVPICPVPTFEAFALYAVKHLNNGAEFAIARNVNVEEIYAARFRKENDSYKFITGVEIIKKIDFGRFTVQGDILFGNFKYNDRIPEITDVDALTVAEWSVKYGTHLITKEYDYLEPDYLKKFEGRKQQ